MWKFILHEWKYWLKAPMTWVFLLINTLLILGAVASDQVSIGGSTGSVHKNAPYVIENYYGIMSLICLLMTTAYMNATANRDFEHRMYQFVFSSPIKKHHYFFGKFFGAATIAVLPLLGISIGALAGPLISTLDPERFGEVIWSGHLNGLLVFGIPNTLISGVFLFGLAVVFRSNIVSFVGAMFILVFYVLSIGYTKDIENEWIANIIDPFGFSPERILSKYMTVDEKNTTSVPLTGALLINRLVWLSLCFLSLLIFYFKFSFSDKKIKSRKKRSVKEQKSETPGLTFPVLQKPEQGLNALSWLRMIKFELNTLITNPTFIILMILGMINLIASLTSFTDEFGLKQYPVTYNVVDTIKGSFYLFLVAIITFYSGVLVWRERDYRINEIEDATPMNSSVLFSSKLVALIVVVALIQICTILVGITAQSMYGYFRFEPEVYVVSLLGFDLLNFTYLMVISLLMHYLINNRYIAYFAFVAFIILNDFIWQILQIGSNMLAYGSTPTIIYSDMNGFGPFVKSAFWFHLYWSLFSILVLFVIRAFYVRGKETSKGKRIKNAGEYLKVKKWQLTCFLVLFLCCSVNVYYNTIILNKFENESEQEEKKFAYEKKYKKYENILQPRYSSFDYHIDIFPETRSLRAEIKAIAKNKSEKKIEEIHFTLPAVYDNLAINIPGAKLKMDDKKLNYRIFKLHHPLNPGDSLAIDIQFVKQSRGFENEISFLSLTHNGTFFNNTDIVPQIGYVSAYEINEKNKRKELKLPPKKRSIKLDENNMAARANTYISHCSDWVEVKSTVSTSSGQIAIAPGSLRRKWTSNGRNYFQYQLDQNSLDFYSFLSGEYLVARKKFKEIDLEVYYIKEHSYNVPNMLRSMEKSLEYYTTNFGKYYHKQCRIIEFPRYAGFAQAFPGTMPYSESIGFIADLRDVSQDDIDLVFYVVAHEMGHQYWAHQLCGAEMQGSEWMSEGFAQYSALMVMEKEYGRDKMNRFLKYEMDKYLQARGKEMEAEQALYKTESQPYIHYQKASIAMYYLKELIGENKVNEALKSLIDTFAYKPPPYPTSLHALRAVRRMTPDSLQYAVNDLFENITLFSNRLLEAKSRKVENGYEVTLICSSEKFRADSLGNEKEIGINDYIDIACFGKPEGNNKLGKKIFYERRIINRENNTLVFRTAEEPFMAGIDPYNYLIDRVPDDNLKRVSEN